MNLREYLLTDIQSRYPSKKGIDYLYPRYQRGPLLEIVTNGSQSQY